MRCWRGTAQCWMMNAFVECTCSRAAADVPVASCVSAICSFAARLSPLVSSVSAAAAAAARHSYNYIKAPVNKTLQRAAAAARGLLGGEARAQDREGLSK